MVCLHDFYAKVVTSMFMREFLIKKDLCICEFLGVSGCVFYRNIFNA